ncbi:response regulator [Halonotius aquaticus]|jgi:DNA-binding response OmpR family regulator|uniref:Response regulator n=1 Tax=Halonotius aquaticus TaxID=2216978 RepID=A0A3A6Q1H2_9EURY|nr:HalX domain-containing protein [Halonotius aquaticus]RJX42999.1 response regulator [Halonotius aquaticus]
MTTISTDDATILVVDDERDVADLYAFRLEEHYTVRTAYGGQEALDAFDSDIDVILLDRRMPGLTGDEVLQRVREADADVRVVMVTAIDPDVDIVDMDFDDYLCKPIGKETLLEAVEHQLTAREYGETVQELFRATSKVGVLEAEKSAEELEESAEYQELTQRIEELRAEQSELIEELDDFEAAFNAIDRAPKEPMQ